MFGGLRRRLALADPHRLDAVLAHRFDPDRVAVRASPCRRAWAAARVRRTRSRRPSCRRRCRRAGAARSPARSVTATWPRTNQSPLASRRTSPPAGSVSSSISPTTSSMMSSTVTMPATRPYSSITTASEVRWRWRSASRSSSGLVSGTIGASVHDRLDRRLRALGHQQPRERVRVDDAAHAVLVVVLGDDQARVARRDAAPQRGLDVVGDVDRHDRRDRRHDLARLLLVQVEDAGEHARLARVQVAARVALGDDRLELLGRRRPPRATRSGSTPQAPQDPVGDRGQHRR